MKSPQIENKNINTFSAFWTISAQKLYSGGPVVAVEQKSDVAKFIGMEEFRMLLESLSIYLILLILHGVCDLDLFETTNLLHLSRYE